MDAAAGLVAVLGIIAVCLAVCNRTQIRRV